MILDREKPGRNLTTRIADYAQMTDRQQLNLKLRRWGILTIVGIGLIVTGIGIVGIGAAIGSAAAPSIVPATIGGLVFAAGEVSGAVGVLFAAGNRIKRYTFPKYRKS